MMAVLRLLSYNVRSLRDDPAAVARVIRDAVPHVVCIQEAPRQLRWRAGCAALARRSGLVVVTGGRTAAGNLILSSLAVDALEVRDVLLSRVPGLHQRGVALARLRWRGAEFAVAGTHLDLEPIARLNHAGQVLDCLRQLSGGSGPSVVAADVNDVDTSPVWASLTANHRDAFATVEAAGGAGDGRTFPTTNPTRRIDAIFIGGAVTAVAAQVLDSADVRTGSDHRPLLAELEIG
jgi:endonuclease/exonuclease/phosphatase family metal-dependent hydrolase